MYWHGLIERAAHSGIMRGDYFHVVSQMHELLGDGADKRCRSVTRKPRI
jgi:hypothetical protein